MLLTFLRPVVLTGVMDHLEAVVYWRAAYRAIIPVLEEVLADMRYLARRQSPIRRVELGMMDIALVTEQLAHVTDRLAYWERMVPAPAMDA